MGLEEVWESGDANSVLLLLLPTLRRASAGVRTMVAPLPSSPKRSTPSMDGAEMTTD